MTYSDLTLYLLMVQRTKMKNEVDVKYKGGTDMSKKLEQMAVEAINQYHSQE